MSRRRRRTLVAVAALVVVALGAGAGATAWWLAPPPPPTAEQREQGARLEGLLRSMPGAYSPHEFRAGRPFSRDYPDVIPRPLLRSEQPIVLTFDAKELEKQRRRIEQTRDLLDDDLKLMK